MQVFLKLIILIGVFLSLKSNCLASQTRIIVAPLSMQTVNSTAGLYPSISDHMAADVINNLNRNLLYDVMDLNSTEKLIMSYGLWEKYRNFLKDYKDKGNVDYKVCQLLYEKLGVHKIILVSSGFSMQSMMLERPFLYRIGLIELEPVQSFYRLNVFFTMIDTQSGLIDFKKNYKQNFQAGNFEVPSNSLSDNIFSSEKIKKFSDQLAEEIFTDVCIITNQSAYTNVKSSIITSREGIQTRDGHSFLTNKEHLKNKRKDSFKNWIRERIDF